eukprot:gb/GEZJ01003160.1/.p1 GENE.gb/GEZJ01003160.1/~~gb/GEZJ01003160.1/.p1  ORF type:complete len:902 (-),score=97.13 gb/GEZJ01003160.1/:755-3196(-)
MPSTICSVCAEQAVDWAVGHCPHVVCGDCFHRMRVLYQRKTCVMCKDTVKQVVFVPLQQYTVGMNFDQAVSLPRSFHDKKVDIWFIDRDRCDQLRTVRGWKCSHRSCSHKHANNSVFPNAEQLRAHVKTQHRCVYCNVCFNGAKSFVSELQLYPLDKDRNYSSRQKAHMRRQHPMCRFCRKYFLDDDSIYSHLQEEHETCILCERNNRMHEYYVNFEQLEHHYEHEHYVCKHEACRGLVFATNIELQAHLHTRHGDASRGNRSRALRVNLHDLHREQQPRRPHVESPHNVERERELQAVRRRAFLSSNVVFSGAFEDAAPNAVPEMVEAPPVASASMHPPAPSSAAPSTPQVIETGVVNADSDEDNGSTTTRRPDDGRFHPLSLPRDGEERQARNTMLVRTMRSLLEPAEYEEFRTTSAQFRNGTKGAEVYYDAVVNCFGVRAAVRDILPELVALLPNPLLREPLLQVCLRRTNTPGSEAGYLNPGGPSASSQQSSNGQPEQFPTLSDAPPPRRKTPKVQRFGTLGPEEFPRLGRIKRKSQAPQQEPNQAPSSSAARPTPNASRKERETQQRKTAASILREAPPSERMRNLRVSGAPAPSARTPSASVSAISTSAFPSLPSASASAAVAPVTPRVQSSNGSTPNAAGPSSFADFPALGASSSAAPQRFAPNKAGAQPGQESSPSADVSMRVGAVWGGAGTNGRGGAKRGPGNKRRPATPPKSVALASSDIPGFRATSRSGEGAASQSSSAPHSVAGNPNNVIDVVQIAKARREALQKSSVPKIGAGGFGFAWERKKAQQKKKEIKNSMNVDGQ